MGSELTFDTLLKRFYIVCGCCVVLFVTNLLFATGVI